MEKMCQKYSLQSKAFGTVEAMLIRFPAQPVRLPDSVGTPGALVANSVEPFP